MRKISVTIISFNEAVNIARALRSVSSISDDLVVVDSFSHDHTCEVAREFGAKVVQRKFTGYGDQKNFAASLCQNDWIFSIDADEELSPELIVALQKFSQEEGEAPFPLYKICRRTSFREQWIYHGGWYPDRIPRLYHKAKASWTNPQVHERLLAHEDLPLGFIEGHLNHYSFPTFKSQIDTNTKYAFFGAHELIKKGRPSLAKLFYKPVFKFLECYLYKRGFMDGLAGLVIALNAAHSLYMKYAFAYFDLSHQE